MQLHGRHNIATVTPSKYHEHMGNFAIFELYVLAGTELKSGKQTWDIKGARAEVEVGAERKRITATRVVALGVFALAAKKNMTKVFLTITLADGEEILIETDAKKEAKARKFATAINNAAR
jgi:hypothetical protein